MKEFLYWFVRCVLYSVMHTWSCVQRYARAGRPVGSPESAVTSSKVQNGVYKGRCFARFLCCVKVYHNLDHLDVLYRDIRAYCSL